MPKLERGYEGITCPYLKEAYDEAHGQAMDNLGGLPMGYAYSERYGNQVCSKGTGQAKATCPHCSKRVEVILAAPPADVRDMDNRPLRAFDPIDAEETVKVSGVECPEGLQEK